MKEEKVFKAEDVEHLLKELYEDILNELKEIKGKDISTVKIENLNSVTNQDARLVSVKGSDMADFKKSGGGFLGKSTNLRYVALPDGEYIHLEEFIAALHLYFSKKMNAKRKFIVDSDEWNNKPRKVDKNKLDELKKITRESSRIYLDKITSITTQDARVISANIPGDSLTHDKKIGGAFLGSESGNLTKGLPEQLMPLDDSPYIYKEDVIKALERIFKAYREVLVAVLPVPILSMATAVEAEVQVEKQEEDVPEYEEVALYSDGLVIGDVLNIEEGTKFTNDCWGNPKKGFFGNQYIKSPEATTNGFAVMNTVTGAVYPYFELGKALDEVLEQLKSEGKISEGNYKVAFHVNEGLSFTDVNSINDIGWIPYDQATYPVVNRYSIGTETQKVQNNTSKEQTQYTTYTYETEDMNEEMNMLIMTNENGDMLILTKPDGSSFKLDEDIVLVDTAGNEHKCTVEKKDKKIELKAIVPVIIPFKKKEKAKDEEEVEEKDTDGDLDDDVLDERGKKI